MSRLPKLKRMTKDGVTSLMDDLRKNNNDGTVNSNLKTLLIFESDLTEDRLETVLPDQNLFALVVHNNQIENLHKIANRVEGTPLGVGIQSCFAVATEE